MLLGLQNIAWGMGPKSPSTLMQGSGATLSCENPYQHPTLAGLTLDMKQGATPGTYLLQGTVLQPDGAQRSISDLGKGRVTDTSIRLKIPGAGVLLLKLEMLRQDGPTFIGSVNLFSKIEELFICRLSAPEATRAP